MAIVKRRLEWRKSGEEWRGEKWSDHGERDHVLTISGRRTLRIGVLYRLLRWPAVPPVVTIPDTYGGKLAAMH